MKDLRRTLLGWTALAVLLSLGAAGRALPGEPAARPGVGTDAWRDANGTRFEAGASGGVRALLGPAARRAVRRPARVDLPSFATGATRIEDEISGVAVSFVLQGAADVALELPAEGVARYPGAVGPSTDLFQRARGDGTEDLAVFARRPAAEQLVYTLEVSAAGLRLVADSLELLDAGGVPRLRVAPPLVEDARGHLHAARLTARERDGGTCRVDTSTAVPWRRPVLAACAVSPCRCELRVAWNDLGVIYPAVVDPAWTTTGDLASARDGHASGRLPNGDVFVVGGFVHTPAGQITLATMEIFDAAHDAWAMGPPLGVPRCFHSASVLADGAVLVAGGIGDGVPSAVLLHSVEMLSASTSIWMTRAPMPDGRQSHTASVLADDQVLVAGGIPTTSPLDIGASYTEIYHRATDTWSEGPQMNAQRKNHSATVLDPTHVFVAGGFGVQGPVATAEMLDLTLAQWSPLEPMASARTYHAAVLLPGGAVIVTGGETSLVTAATASTEIFDRSRMQWRPGPTMTAARAEHSATRLADGTILVAGGANVNERLASAEVLPPDAGAWVPAGTMAHAHAFHTAAPLLDGRAIVAAGFDGQDDSAHTEIFSLLDGGAPCKEPGECASVRCAAGVCCDQPCNGVCQACTAAEKDGGPDGVCAATVGNPCGAFTCTASGDCAATCSASIPCAEGYVCAPTATCLPAAGGSCDGGTAIRNDGSTESCGLFLCNVDAGGCPGECFSNADCVEGANCDDQRCAPAPSNGDPGCTCTAAVPAAAGVGAFTAALTALSMTARRRSRRAHGGAKK